MDLDAIRREALSLSPQERAELAEQLLSSLEELSEAECEALWLQEAVRRAADIDRGASPRIPAEEVSRQARDLLR